MIESVYHFALSVFIRVHYYTFLNVYKSADTCQLVGIARLALLQGFSTAFADS